MILIPPTTGVDEGSGTAPLTEKQGQEILSLPVRRVEKRKGASRASALMLWATFRIRMRDRWAKSPLIL
jgi:hypothetical protein